MEGSLTIILQLRLCSPLELENITGITGGAGECLERCQGPIVDVERLPSLKNEEALAGLLSQYENIKYPDHNNITYPFAMKGGKDERELECSVIFLVLEFKNRLKFVKISFATSTFDRIKKVQLYKEIENEKIILDHLTT